MDWKLKLMKSVIYHQVHQPLKKAGDFQFNVKAWAILNAAIQNENLSKHLKKP